MMASATDSARYDVVVFGASGFTGQYVVEELARTIEEERPGMTWAVAGRSISKLQAVLAEAQRQTGKNLEDIPTICADVNSEQSLKKMCQKAKLVLNCVGPYKLHGEQVVRACLESGTHHIDISGEQLFMEKVQLVYDAKAKEKGIYIIGACGWDSIPGEMLLQYTKEHFDGDLNTVEGYVQTPRGPDGGHMNYGTWHSAVHAVSTSDELKATRTLLSETQKAMPECKHGLPKRPPIFYNKSLGNYCIPFFGSDAAVVKRTQIAQYSAEKQRPVQFTAYSRVPTFLRLVRLMIMGILLVTLAKFSFGRTLLEKYPEIFSFGTYSKRGPSRKQIAGTSFSWKFKGHGYATKVEDPDEQHYDLPSKTIVTQLNGPDAAYASTPICMVQAAYLILTQTDKLPAGGGVLTPGYAFSKTDLIKRLSKHHHNFQILEQ